MAATEAERRRHRRLPMRLAVLYRFMDSSDGAPRRGKTLNVSTGGLLMEIRQDGMSAEIGHLMKIDMQTPEAGGLFELGGRISGVARVIRVPGELPAKHDRSRIALQFCQRPRFDV
ncbi:MAG: hypothetical protein GWO86_02440 [Planctomycetes bacterium]|nr:hypothetical protein [Planctomycetota bacterium]